MVAIYARQSKEKHDSVSIETQIEKCVNLCQYNDWNYCVYKDIGRSGKNLDRPDFSRLMKDLKNGKIKKILCYKLDRISRSIADFSQLILTFEDYGAEFISATENFDTSTPLGRAMVNIIITFAQLERETITERITDNYYFRGNKGYWPGGPPPFGYIVKKEVFDGKNQSVLEINPEEAEIVKAFYNWYLEKDGSVRKILTKANELGIKSRNGIMWTSRVVVDLLWKPLYTANTVEIYKFFESHGANILNDISDFDGLKSINLYGKTNKNANRHKRCRDINEQYLIVSNHKPIIPDDIWLKVQNKKGFKLPAPPRLGQSKNSFLTGLMKCAYCGYSVSIMKNKKKCNDKVYVSRYYVCSTRKNRGKDICSLPLINADKLDEDVIKDLIKHYTSIDIKRILNVSTEKEKISSEYLFKKNEIDMKLLNIDKEIDNLVSSLSSNNSVLFKYIEKKVNELEDEKLKLECEKQNLDLEEFGEISQLEDLEYILDYGQNIESKIRLADFDELKYICNILIKEIIVFEHEISVVYTV